MPKPLLQRLAKKFQNRQLAWALASKFGRHLLQHRTASIGGICHTKRKELGLYNSVRLEFENQSWWLAIKGAAKGPATPKGSD
jgi:hypothetical protein